MKLKVSNDHLIQNQRIQIESGLQRIKEIKHSKGKTAAIFDVFNNIKGGKKNRI